MAVNVGATIFTPAYPGSGSTLAAGTDFDNFVQRPMATNCAVVYIIESDWPVTMDTRDVGALSGAGVQLCITTELPYPVTSEGIGWLTDAFQLWQDNGVDFVWGGYNEPNGSKAHSLFPTAADYATWVQGYNAVATAAGVTRVYKPLVAFDKQAVSYYPGDAYVDVVLADYYSTDYITNPGKYTLGNVMALADNHQPDPIPFGLGETGLADNSKIVTPAAFSSWLNNQVLNVFLAREAQGKVNDKIMWFADGQSNTVNATTSPQVIQAIQSLYDQLMTSNPPPPPVALSLDYPDFQTPSAHANAIANTGAPLLLLPGTSVTETTFSLEGGASLTLPQAAITQIGYEMYIAASIGDTATAPFLKLRVEWDDVTSGLPVARENWEIPCGPPNTDYVVMITGVAKGSLLTIEFTNDDPAVTAFISFAVLANSQVYTRDRIMVYQTASPPGYTSGATNSGFNVLGSASNESVGAGDDFEILLALYAGDVQVYFDQMGNTAANSTAQLTVLPTSRFGTGSFWSASPAGGVGSGVSQVVRFPRAPVLMTYTNSGADTAKVNFKAVSLDENI